MMNLTSDLMESVLPYYSSNVIADGDKLTRFERNFYLINGVLGSLLSFLVFVIGITRADTHDKPRQIIVMSMTFADLITCLVYMLTRPFLNQFDRVMCYPYYVIIFTSQLCSCLNLLWLNFDKLIYIKFPLHYYQLVTRKRILALTVVSWMALVVLALAVYSVMEVVKACDVVIISPLVYLPICILYVMLITNSFVISAVILCIAQNSRKIADEAKSRLLKRLFFVFSSTVWTFATCLPYRLLYLTNALCKSCQSELLMEATNLFYGILVLGIVIKWNSCSILILRIDWRISSFSNFSFGCGNCYATGGPPSGGIGGCSVVAAFRRRWREFRGASANRTDTSTDDGNGGNVTIEMPVPNEDCSRVEEFQSQVRKKAGKKTKFSRAIVNEALYFHLKYGSEAFARQLRRFHAFKHGWRCGRTPTMLKVRHGSLDHVDEQTGRRLKHYPYKDEPFLLGLFAYIVLIFVKAGYFKSVQVSVVEEPPVLSQGITVFYKYCLGPYGDTWKTLHDVVDILPQENTTLFGIFYDNPKVTNSDKCQAAVGCVYKIKDETLFEDNFAIQLTRWGFERMVLPAVGRAVYCKQPYGSVISKMHIAKIRSQFNEFSKENRLETGDCSVEVYKRTADGGHFVEMFKPLDHVEDFYIPEVTNSDKCQAAVGCVYKIKDETLFEDNFAIQLTRWGFERMVLPAVGRAVYCKQPYGSVISKMHIAKIRSQFNEFSKENRLETGDCSVEVYKRTADGGHFVEMFKPLDHVEDFYIPEV